MSYIYEILFACEQLQIWQQIMLKRMSFSWATEYTYTHPCTHHTVNLVSPLHQKLTESTLAEAVSPNMTMLSVMNNLS
jgi:hypothetical protein